jgi:hypothetical protein
MPHAVPEARSGSASIQAPLRSMRIAPVRMREMCEWPLRFLWLGLHPLDGPVHRGSSDPEEFGELSLGVVPLSCAAQASAPGSA